jgi:hypothetical protein
VFQWEDITGGAKSILGVANRTAITALTIVHRDQPDAGISDVFDTDWKAPDASNDASISRRQE